MIKKFIDKLLGKSAGAINKSRFGKRQEVGPEEHGIDRQQGVVEVEQRQRGAG